MKRLTRKDWDAIATALAFIGAGAQEGQRAKEGQVMGYVFAMVTCFACRQPFTCNPMKVPVCVHDGGRHPVCLACVHRVNPQRVKQGLEPIVPLPGAYDECDEGELG